MQEGAGERERERDTNTGVSGKGTLPCPKTRAAGLEWEGQPQSPPQPSFPSLSQVAWVESSPRMQCSARQGMDPLFGQGYLESAAVGSGQGSTLASPWLAEWKVTSFTCMRFTGLTTPLQPPQVWVLERVALLMLTPPQIQPGSTLTSQGSKRRGRTRNTLEVSTYRSSRNPHCAFVSLAMKTKPEAIGNRPKARS